MHTKAHCEVCRGVGKYLVEDVTYVPYGSCHTAMVTYDEAECSACDGTGMGEDEGCFVCGEGFEPDDTLRLVRDHLVHEGCIGEPWPADGKPNLPEREINEPW